MNTNLIDMQIRKSHILIISLLMLFVQIPVKAQSSRQDILLNDKWEYKPISQTSKEYKGTEITLPHTWNSDYLPGTTTYNREMMVYAKTLAITESMQGKRLFLMFEGANSVADLFVNRKTVAQHKGGYTAFCTEITEYVSQGENEIEVWVSNAYRTDVLPISGDFNIYGGLHRPVRLIVTESDCISPTFYASSGVFVHQTNISKKQADITIETILSITNKDARHTLQTELFDANNKLVAKRTDVVTNERMMQELTIASPVLWHGKRNPHLYKVKVSLIKDGKIIDTVNEQTGLRYFRVDPEKGFFLNDEYVNLYGFCRHEDFKGCGSALTESEYLKDFEIINESGATAMRLAHYPHGKTMYRMSDEQGIMLLTEIPLCGPGGYAYTGYVKSVEENALEVTKEFVYQNFNHPSIISWGVFNELLLTDGKRFAAYDDPHPIIEKINTIYKTLDPSRLTALASCMHETDYIGMTDLMAWNKYFGWKSAETEAGAFFDRAKQAANGQPVGVSEYGAAGSMKQHADPLYHKEYSFPQTYHPEEYQTACHEGYWSAFAKRPYLWCKFIWQFSDMQSSIRREGDTDGINDKGMVSYDRSERKDVFYFYKANWNSQPMLHLTSKRFTQRNYAITTVKAYSNMDDVTLYVNDKRISKIKPDSIRRAVWNNIKLQKGDNTIRVVARKGKQTITDQCVWTLN